MMEGLDKLKGSCKAYWSYLTHIYRKLQELNLTQPPNDDTAMAVMSYVEQLQRKAESIQQLDMKIQSMMKEPTDIEGNVIESLDIQDTLIKRMIHLKRYLEKAKITTDSLTTSNYWDYCQICNCQPSAKTWLTKVPWGPTRLADILVFFQGCISFEHTSHWRWEIQLSTWTVGWQSFQDN